MCSAGSAVNRNRTGDLITTNDALYLLSYDGKKITVAIIINSETFVNINILKFVFNPKAAYDIITE